MGKETNAIDRHVGERVYRARKDRGLTQRQLATAIGTTYQQLQKYEQGTNRIGVSRLFAISEALDVPISYFFMGVENASKTEPVKRILGPNLESALEGAVPNEAARAIVGLCRAIAQSKRAG